MVCRDRTHRRRIAPTIDYLRSIVLPRNILRSLVLRKTRLLYLQLPGLSLLASLVLDPLNAVPIIAPYRSGPCLWHAQTWTNRAPGVASPAPPGTTTRWQIGSRS